MPLFVKKKKEECGEQKRKGKEEEEVGEKMELCSRECRAVGVFAIHPYLQSSSSHGPRCRRSSGTARVAGTSTPSSLVPCSWRAVLKTKPPVPRMLTTVEPEPNLLKARRPLLPLLRAVLSLPHHCYQDHKVSLALLLLL